MKILVQWTKDTATDWVEIDSSEWNSSLPKKPEPVGGEVLDDSPGWIFDLNVQGICFATADHYTVEELDDGTDGIRITAWLDDPDDYRRGEYFARVTTIYPLGEDSDLGNAYNTRQTHVFYAGNEIIQELRDRNIQDAIIRPYGQFIKPAEEDTRHAIWTSDELAAEYLAVRGRRGWREWTDGVPEDMIDPETGHIIDQRKAGRYSRPRHTITWYQRGEGGGGGTGDDADSDLTPAIWNYKLTENSTTAHYTYHDVTRNTTDELGIALSTEAGVPNDAAWATGDYRVQVDISAFEAVQVTSSSQLVRVNSTGTVQETIGTSGAFSSTGLNLFTVSAYSPSAGAAGDRYQVRLYGTNTALHAEREVSYDMRHTDAFVYSTP
jgi:hypothetical protein